MKVQDLTHNPKNPRTITDEKLEQLKQALLEFGDLSGIVFNRKTKHLVGGHQRTKHFDEDSVVTITKKYPKPSKTGTVAEGYIDLFGERFSYREVSWPLFKERAANLAANKGAGEWDVPELQTWLKELGSFDADLDLSFTMFDSTEIAHLLPDTTSVKAHEREKTQVSKALIRRGDRYWVGPHMLICGEQDGFCDETIKRWEKFSGVSATRIEDEEVAPSKKKSASRNEIEKRI